MVSLEEENFLRIVYLYYRVVTPSLKRFFDGKHSNLSADLSANKTKLFQLYNPPPGQTRVLYKQQIDTLYPPTGSPPVASADFDLTLMVCLLRNLPPVVTTPRTGFDKLPPRRDTTYGANIARIKYYKNYLVSHSTSGKIVVNVFNDIWKELEMAIKGLGSAQDEADAKIAKTKILDSSMTTLLSTQHLLEIKIAKLEKRMEREEITKTEITTRIKTFEEQTLTAEKSTKQLIEENKNKTSETLKEMQDKSHGECTRVDTNVKVIEKEIAELKKLHVGLSADDTIKQIESKCSEIQRQLSVHDERISALEEVKLQEDVKYSETKLDIEELRTEVAQIKTDQKSVPDWMIDKLEQWKKEDEYFVNTRASEFIKDCLQKHVCVSVVGPSGVGKSFLVQHVALEMIKDGYTIMKVNSPEEIKENFMSNRPTLFVVDDFCGNFTANANRLDAWKRSSNDLTTIIKSNAVKLIVTCRLQVFQDEGFKHTDFHIFKTCICNLVEKSIALTDSEKESMLLKYVGIADTNGLECLYQYDFFPLLCKLLNTKKDQSNFCMKTFLEDPFSSFEDEFNDLYVDCKEGKYKIVALLLLVICNNHLDETVSKGKLTEVEVKHIIENILEQCCINECVRFKSLIKELDTLIGTFVLNEKGIYHTIHDKLFDFLVYYFGTKNKITKTDFCELLIRCADEKVIEERFVIKEPGQSHDSKSKEYVITIQDDNLQFYTKRVFDDMKKPNDGINCLWLNRNRKNKTFQDSLCTIIENLEDDEISNLIETASSGFVRDMFVMDVNDITIYFPYGIISNHVRLQKLIKRIFDDITNSDYVEDYIRRCRCCRNETFCSALQAYMTNLSSTEIKELIKSCSTSFVDLMFVMETENNTLNTPHVYKRYGVVIPTDMRRDYIERVFEDTSRSDHVYGHLHHNRNQTHTIFRTELHHLMGQLDRLKIIQLITYASQNFIDQLCLITEEDTKINFDWEDGCYGVVIPTDCIILYMTRWFDGLTKTNQIENYFEHNRNTHTQTFQTSLRTYMELQEDKVENLIHTASNVFLKKLFVTTKKDIKQESNKEYEHYGIVLKDKYVAMYTEKLVDSMSIYDHFINDIKGIRTFRQVLEYNRELGISKITELLHTASDVFFHKMIAVDIENEPKVEKKYSDYQNFDYVLRGVLEMNEGFIRCPFSLIYTYIDRMIEDWGKGHIYGVIENINWENQSFVNYFSHHLKQLEPSKLSHLVHIVDHECQDTALALSCIHGNVNFLELCFNIILHENPGEEQCKSCALFLLVVFNNKLDEKFLKDDITMANTLINAFRKTNNITKDISVMNVKEELNTSLNGIVVRQLEGIYSAIYKDLFVFFVFYFASVRHMSKILVEYASEKVIYKRLLIDNSFHQQNNFFVQLTDEELQTCIKKVFKMMTNSGKITRYTLDKGNHMNVESITAYAKTITNREIRTIIEEACIDFINKIFLIAGKETEDHNDEYMVPYIVIPEDSILVYIKMMLFHMAKHDCVEECLQDNRNKKNKTFHRKLIIHMREITRKEIEVLIQEASSDFINRIFVISEEDIKDDSSWEYERYGIVVPEDLLQMYIERVVSDMTTSVYLPVNRNSENKTFRDTLCSHINSFSGSEFEKLIETASIKFIRRMIMSTEGELGDLDTKRYENYHMCVPKQYFRPGPNTQSFEDLEASLTEYDLNKFTIRTCEDINRKDALITVRSKINIDSLQQLLSKYIDPMFTSKIIEVCVRLPNELVGKYTGRMIAEWMKGNVHDVLGNVNLNSQSFRSNFLTHLRSIETSTQLKLTETTDNQTGDSALAVSCRFGIIKLVQWCLDNKANTNSCNNYNEYPLYIAINQNRPDIVYSLLHSSIKADVNRQMGIFLTLPLYDACKNGNNEIVSMLLMENIDVNEFSNHSSEIWETALYVACKYGHNEIVYLLLNRKANHIGINIGMFLSGKTPLYIACKRGHTQIVSILLKHDADDVDVNQCTYKKVTPLFVACKGGYTDIVLLLLARSSKAVKKNRIDGASPLWIACQEGHYDVVSTLLNHEYIEIDTCLLNGMSPLFIASFLGNTKIVETLLRKGADANICVKKQKIIRGILEKFEGVYRKPQIVDSNKCIEYFRKLVSENASEHVKSYVYKKREDWVFNSIFETSPLHMGSLMGNTEIVKLLVESNSHINCFSENGSTPLFLACELGHEDIVHILLSKGADPTLDRKDLKTPLIIARENGHTEIVEILNSQIVKS